MMKKHFSQKLLVLLSMAMLAICAFVSIIVVNAVEYRTVRINYEFSNGDTAYDPYIAVVEKDSSVNIDITNPTISGYLPVDSENQLAPHTLIKYDELSEDVTLTVFYVPDTVPYTVKYFKQNIYDDDYTADLTLDSSYYEKEGLTGTFPSDLNSVAFPGFTKLYHKPDFIAADGSTEFELYYTRNYYLINFDLNGGHGVEPVYAKYQSNYNIPEPARKGYVFEGWVLSDKNGNYVDEQGNILTDEQACAAARKFTSGIVPDHNVNYKAYWSAGDTHYTVVYWIEDPNKAGTYTDVATEEIDKYTDNHHVKTNDTVYVIAPEEQIEDMYVVKDFFSHNLNPQQTEKNDDGTVKLDDQLRPIYVTNADGKPIDDQGNVLDFPEMSPGERNDLNGKEHYFEIDPDKTVSSAIISGDGTTCINVYYKRKPITQRFFFARKFQNEETYQVPGYTKAFSTADGTLNKHLSNSCGGGRTDWMTLTMERPQLKDSSIDVHEYTIDNPDDNNLHSGQVTYYYYEMKTKYGANMRSTWLTEPFEPFTITEGNSGSGQTVRFGAWSGEWGTPYAVRGNSTVKGFYETLDNALLYTNTYLQKTNNAGEYLHEDPTVLNYLSFWTNAQNQNWNMQNNQYIYNFTYKQYVEILPSEYNADGDDLSDAVKASNKYVDTIVIDYDVPSATPSTDGYGQVVLHSDKKIYGLLPTNITETYDAGDQYKNLTGPNIPNDGRVNKKYLDRDEAVKINQTPAALEGFEILSDAEVAKAKDGSPLDVQYPGGVKRKQNPICNWYAANDFDADHHCDIKFLYRRRYYTLTFINNFEKSSATQTRNIYYQWDINSTGIRGNWVYYEPEYIANVEPELREYYTFDGWRFDEDQEDTIPVLKNDPNTGGRSHFNSDFTMPADDITLYAKWSLKKNNVSFYNDYEVYSDPNGTPLSTCEVEYNSLILTQDIPTTNHEDNRPKLLPPVAGATFTGWYYLNEAGEELRYEPENIPVVRELNLYAKWTSDQSAGYLVEYVEKGTDTPVADPVTGVAYVTTTKSFNAKVGNELNEAHRPQENQKNWWPVVSSHSIVIKANQEGEDYAPNVYRFEYTKKENVWYTVKYLDAATLEPLFPDEEKNTSAPTVTEYYRSKYGYMPDRVQKTLILSASVNTDTDEAKAEELAMNTIVFLYTKKDSQALVRIEHYLQKVDGDPDKKTDYEHYRDERITKTINDTLDINADVYQTDIAKSLTDSHYNIRTDFTEVYVNNELFTEQPITVTNAPLVVKVYYERSKYPYKVLHIDYNSGTVLQPDLHTNQADWKPMGSVVYITPEESIVKNGVTYLPITDTPQPLTIFYEANLDDPQTNVKTIYYRKQDSVQLNYEIICNGAVEGELQLSQNYEIVSRQEDIGGCQAIIDCEEENKYEFLGWYLTRTVNQEFRLSTNMEYVPTLPLNDTTYYAIFKMNPVPYTLNYVYQGRKGGNDGSYIGDDAETDEKVFTVNLDLSSDSLDENGVPVASVLVDHAPAVDDLYKDCIWTINDDHVTYDKTTRTVTITAVQTPRKYIVEFYYAEHSAEPETVTRVPLNSLVRRDDGSFIEAPETDDVGSPFAYWRVVENDKEIARCYNRGFNLRVTGDYKITAMYTTPANVLSISDPRYTRQQYDDANGNKVDKLQVDFLLAYMESNGLLLNSELATDRGYNSGIVVEYFDDRLIDKADVTGAKLSDNDKATVTLPGADPNSVKTFIQSSNNSTANDNQHLLKYIVPNSYYNNKNRVDRAISFTNSESARHMVFRAYYYVSHTDGDKTVTELTEPVTFYLYDIGNSKSNTGGD